MSPFLHFGYLVENVVPLMDVFAREVVGWTVITNHGAVLALQTFLNALGAHWENAFQESFFSQFKIDLGDPQRFASLGEFVYAIHRTVWEYNHTRIHLALKMPPKLYAEQQKNLVENYSKERGA